MADEVSGGSECNPAAAINLRVRQLEAQGITGIAFASHMIGHMQDLHRIYNTASDQTLRDLCRRFPRFERYARLMEGVSEQNQAMVAAGTHPYGDLPELPEPLKASLLHLMRAGAELERWSASFRPQLTVGEMTRPSG